MGGLLLGHLVLGACAVRFLGVRKYGPWSYPKSGLLRRWDQPLKSGLSSPDPDILGEELKEALGASPAGLYG